MGKGCAGSVDLSGTNQESEAASGGDEPGSGGEDVCEALHGAKGNNVEALADGFGASGDYIDVRQCNGANDLAQESGLLMAGLDQGKGDFGRPELDRDAGKAGP